MKNKQSNNKKIVTFFKKEILSSNFQRYLRW